MNRAIVMLLAVAAGWIQPVGATEGPTGPGGRGPMWSWTRLTFEGGGVGATVVTTLDVTTASVAGHELAPVFGPGLVDAMASAENSLVLTVDTSLKSLVMLSVRYTEYIWFDPAGNRVLGRIRKRQGADPWVKTYRFTGGGVYKRNIRPATREQAGQPPAQWTQRTETFYRYPENADPCPTVSDPTLIVGLLSSARSGKGEPPDGLCVFGKKQRHRLSFLARAVPAEPVAFRVRTPSGTVRVDETADTTLWTVAAEPADTDGREPEPFALLGLERDIRVWIDPSRRLPVRIAGSHAAYGEWVLRLTEAVVEPSRPS